MSIFTKIGEAIGLNVSEAIDSIGNVIDNLSTTDEEKLEAKAKLMQISNQLKIATMKSSSEYEQQLTERLKADMTSDSWLSKSIRPFALAFLTVGVIALAYASIFILPNEINQMLSEWIDLFKTLLITVYTFYFGSRGIEKIKAMRN